MSSISKVSSLLAIILMLACLSANIIFPPSSILLRTVHGCHILFIPFLDNMFPFERLLEGSTFTFGGSDRYVMKLNEAIKNFSTREHPYVGKQMLKTRISGPYGPLKILPPAESWLTSLTNMFASLTRNFA